MLLPSALPCDMFGTQQISRPQRPKLQSFGPYDATTTPTRSGPGGLFASCRTLQSILGGPTQPPQQLSSMEHSNSSSHPPSNLFGSTQRLQSPPRIAAPPRNTNKRRRDDYEEDEDTTMSNSEPSLEERNPYKTPKRRRRSPTNLPAGLEPSDFDALRTPALLQPPLQYQSFPPVPQPTNDDVMMMDDPPNDALNQIPPNKVPWQQQQKPEDRGFIGSVLSKFNFSSSKRDQSDCAKVLGREKDSLGHRWKMLVGEANVGLK